MIKVLFLTVGDRSVASSRVRIYSYLSFLRREGFKAFILHYTSSWQCKKILSKEGQGVFGRIAGKLYSTAVILGLFALAPFFDIVYIQKVALSRFSVMVLKALNPSIIFDFDDAIFLYKDIAHLARESACVIAGNKYLEDFASKYNNRVYRLPTPVEVNEAFFERNGSSVALGWLGSPDASGYLNQLVPAMRELKKRFKSLNIEFMGIGNLDFGEDLDVKKTEWSIEEEKRFLKSINIGIMPLIDDEWAKGKCGYKLLQYMSAGLPCVASRVGIGNEIIKDGVSGFLAEKPEEWLEKLLLLINDASLRQKMGQEGFRLAQELYSYEVNAPKLINILKETKQRRGNG